MECDRRWTNSCAGDDPGPPIDLEVVRLDRALRFSWRPPVDNGGFPVNRYDIRVEPVNPVGPGFLIENVNSLSFPVTGLDNDASYILSVRAKTFDGSINRVGPYASAPEESPGWLPGSTNRCPKLELFPPGVVARATRTRVQSQLVVPPDCTINQTILNGESVTDYTFVRSWNCTTHPAVMVGVPSDLNDLLIPAGRLSVGQPTRFSHTVTAVHKVTGSKLLAVSKFVAVCPASSRPVALISGSSTQSFRRPSTVTLIGSSSRNPDGESLVCARLFVLTAWCICLWRGVYQAHR